MISGPDSTASITLSQTGAGPALSGTLTVNAVAGVADFANVPVAIGTIATANVITATKADTTATGGTAAMTASTSSFDTVANDAWLGSVPTAKWLATSGTSVAGLGDGMLNMPTAVFVDSSGNVYVGDNQNNRVVKYNAAGIYQGWVGWVSSSLPTGGVSGCTSAVVASPTPGWCTGGAAANATDATPMQPFGIWGDNTYLYVTSGAGAILRFNASTGAYAGWIGYYKGSAGTLSDTYTVGCSTLNGSVTPTATPGWCVGGERNYIKSADTIGGFDGPMGISGDATYLYVVNTNPSNIARVNITTGAAAGWIGNINIAGGGTCGSTGTFTTSWCSDASATSQSNSNLDGSLNLDPTDAAGVYAYGGSLYVTDSTERVIYQYTASTGAFVGWVGLVAYTPMPTGGAAGCTTTTNAYTPGWCIGGHSNGTGNPTIDEFNEPSAITGDGTYLYILDNAFRISKIQISDGAYVGWVGGINNASSGGCGATGTFTSGWCNVNGTTATPGNISGMISSATSTYAAPWSGWPTGAIYYSSGGLWLADSGNNRLSEYNSTTGAFIGWTGAATTPTVGWQTGAYSGGGSDDSSFGQLLSGVTTDGSSLFFVDNFRLTNYSINQNSVSYIGWSGEVALPPSSGAAGCSSSLIGGTTPGWCTGGYSQPGPSNWGDWGGSGGITEIPWIGTALAMDSSYIYVADGNTVTRYDHNGVYAGWIGLIGVSPTGGFSGCNGAAVGTITPGWCTGGGENTGSQSGAYAIPAGVYSDGTYLYIADQSNGRIDKVNASTGAFIGWIGKILTSPTGGVSGCAGAAVGTITPGWCTGGTSDNTYNSNGDGSLPYIQGISGDGTYIYVLVQRGGPAIKRFNASTGAFGGWLGVINTNGGTCVAGSGNFTGGWCNGGTAGSGTTGVGSVGGGNSTGIYADSYSIYALTNNGAVSKFNSISGAFVGWRGVISVSPTGGDTGCAGAAVGTFTSGWCTGGNSASNQHFSLPGSLNNPFQISGAGSFIYVADPGNFRVVRLGK